MRFAKTSLTLPTLAAALVLAAVLPAVAAEQYDATTGSSNNTRFDLGVNVGNVERTPAAISAYLKGLPPETQAAVMAACDNFMAHPGSAQAIETIQFCRIAVNG